MSQFCLTTPLGWLLLTESNQQLTEIQLFPTTPPSVSGAPASGVLREAAQQLNEYFCGRRRTFTLPYVATGTPWQKKVWQALTEIPYGETCSYRQIAERVGNPNAARAVGMANKCNPLPILIPCHRVIGADGSLTGYALGLPVKEHLLQMEQRYAHTCI